MKLSSNCVTQKYIKFHEIFNDVREKKVWSCTERAMLKNLKMARYTSKRRK